MSNADAVDTHDVQRLLLRASRKDCVNHVFVRFATVSAGKNFLRKLSGKISWDYSAYPGITTNCDFSVGLTFRGLEALEVPDGYLHVFRKLAPAFSEGASTRAAEHLGDVGTSAVRYWDEEFEPDAIHAVITIYGVLETDIDFQKWKDASLRTDSTDDEKNIHFSKLMCGERLRPPSLQNVPSSSTNEPWHTPMKREHFQTSGSTRRSVDRSPPMWVHFGYRDGLTTNRIRTNAIQPEGRVNTRAINLHEPGELLLGEPRNAGDNPWILVDLPELVRKFFKHGSFGALRRIEQDEHRFREQVNRWVQELERSGAWLVPSTLTAFVRAKLCGRWPNGQVMKPDDRPDQLPERAIETNDFNYDHDQFDDNEDSEKRSANKIGCPYASHIRRMNPRNESGVQTHQRPLFRRGMPYGPWYEDNKDADVERGLLGLFFCSDLENQFEHLLGEWADRKPLGVPGDRHQKDPLVGAHTNSQTRFTINRLSRLGDVGSDVYQSFDLQGFKPFVHTRGTAYCFYPSKVALQQLCDDDWLAEEDEPWLAR